MTTTALTHSMTEHLRLANTGPDAHTLMWQLRQAHRLTPHAESEYRFHPSRKWRFDVAYPDLKVAVEVDGGAFSGGRHARGDGIRRDCEKFSEAAALGWRVLRVLPEHVESGQALGWLERALGLA